MKILTLNGRWSLSQQGNGRILSGRVPGTVHQDLQRAGELTDPYFRDNELEAQWVGESGWQYCRNFSVSRELLSAPRVILRCDGLDTLATLRLNGKRLGRTDNMYRTWEFEVGSLLKLGQNQLCVAFAPVLPYLKKQDQRSPRMYGWTGARLHNAGWLRKEPCNFGWDWGPKLLTAGIWRDVSLLAIEGARLDDVSVRQEHRSGHVTCFVDVSVDQPRTTGGWVVKATLTRSGKTVASSRVPLEAASAECVLPVKAPDLWWPNGLGEPALYELTVELLNERGHLVDSAVRRLGLRTLSLRTRADRFGESFEFVVNGVPFFAKGANWIPADTFAPRVTREDYARLLGDACDANMNMLRVWGGGIYESDTFYELCDELGLCVWQDFMFSCGTYPAFDATFMQNVKQEAIDNVKRLRHHACLALFCGNNELEQGLVGEAWTQTTMSWSDYDKLFNQLLPSVVAEYAPDICYWPGSPHTPGKERADFNNPDRGDAHLWGVWHGKQPFEWYRQCQHRFVSEFGFQSFPHPKTVRAYTVPEDRNITSWVMEHHQRSPIGNTTIINHMTEWFLLPKSFDDTLWLSQIQQGMAMKFAIEHWRRNMPRSMGALYWQLNDCWPVASWSSIDSHGRHKALQYMARHFFAPRLVSGVEDLKQGSVSVFASNDTREPFVGNVDWWATTSAGKKLAEGTLSVRVRQGKSLKVGSVSLSHLLKQQGARDLLVWLELKQGKQRVSENLVTFSRPKHLLLQEPELRASSRKVKGGFEVTVRAKRAALWCWLDLRRSEARFSDNFFHVRPGRVVKVLVKPERQLSPASFDRQLVLRHLGSTHSRR